MTEQTPRTEKTMVETMKKETDWSGFSLYRKKELLFRVEKLPDRKQFNLYKCVENNMMFSLAVFKDEAAALIFEKLIAKIATKEEK